MATKRTAAKGTKKTKKSPSNALGDSSQSLQTFNLLDLQQYTLEGNYSSNASKDFHLFYVGRDDVHDILKYVLSRVSVSLYLNMFGYDDDELNQIIMAKVKDPNVTVMITLDKSQSSGVHEKQLIAEDKAGDLVGFNSHIVIGESATHQISHTKGFVADGKLGAEGSVNWSASGQGTGVWVVTGDGKRGGPAPGYKAQNNTQSIFTDTDTISRFTAELINEHLIAQKQQNGSSVTVHPRGTQGASHAKGK
jgi:hypothetical protein